MRSRGCPGALQAFSGKCFRKQLETALPPPPEPPPLADFPSACPTSIRFGDLDRQGHVNNAVFATSFESGRVGLIYDAETGCRCRAQPPSSCGWRSIFCVSCAGPARSRSAPRSRRSDAAQTASPHATFHEGACAATGCTHHGADRSRDPALVAATARADCAAAGPVPGRQIGPDEKIKSRCAPLDRTGASSGSVTAAGCASIGPRRGYESGP
jgi:acyl-CoA thioester hydrolase